MFSLKILFILISSFIHVKAMTINKLSSVPQLRNSFFALRHGQSLANVAKIISSDPAISTVEHGLSDVGKDQVSTSAQKFAEIYLENKQSEPVAIYSSDFTRARETAEIFANNLLKSNVPLLHESGVQLETRLRERYFGDFNGKSDKHYNDVWVHDANSADHTEYNCESVNSVMKRTTQLVIDIENDLIESEGKNCHVILVAHGDVLQILQTAFLKKDGSVHRSLDHLETATVRELKLSD